MTTHVLAWIILVLQIATLQRGYQLIDAAAVRDLASTAVDVYNSPIRTEWVARELAPMLRQPDAATRIPEAWQKVIEQHAGDGLRWR